MMSPEELDAAIAAKLVIIEQAITAPLGSPPQPAEPEPKGGRIERLLAVVDDILSHQPLGKRQHRRLQQIQKLLTRFIA